MPHTVVAGAKGSGEHGYYDTGRRLAGLRPQNLPLSFRVLVAGTPTENKAPLQIRAGNYGGSQGFELKASARLRFALISYDQHTL